ncbi:MAG: hypothetical protein IJ410_08805 [Oscillospiraceae bacterium]|nr:hypothetical protein [Oscillospiraceae bacterium]
MDDFNINDYIKRCKKFLMFYYLCLFLLIITLLVFSFITVPFKLKDCLFNGLMAFGIICLLLKSYIQVNILVCPYCNEPFSQARGFGLADVPYKCRHCDRIIDSEKPDIHKP